MAGRTPVDSGAAVGEGAADERVGSVLEGFRESSIDSGFVRLSGWGRFPVEMCRLRRPVGSEDLSALTRSGGDGTYIARGLGRSYGDAALNRGHSVVSLLNFNRVLDLDTESGVLNCEAGASLDRVIGYALPRGFFPAITPGTRQVTIGGAIAADVHGKNHHHSGSFSNSVIDIQLLTADGESITCSRDRDPEVFWATTGGMGLTGFITQARIQMRRVETAYVQVRTVRTEGLAATLAAVEAGDREYEYSAAWFDCISKVGRALVMLGRHATSAELRDKADSAFAPGERHSWRVPFVPSFSPLRCWTVGMFNAAYFHSIPSSSARLMRLDRFFYPLDVIADWNLLYGRDGLVQYQFVVPHAAAPTLLPDVLRGARRSGRVPFLGVLKRFGPGNRGTLSFPMEGVTFALDFPVDRTLPAFLRSLDPIVADHGGRVYLAKDAVLSPNQFARMYTRLDEFRQVKQRLDPRGRISSSLARRLKIING